MDEFDRQISFNILKKFVTSLPVAIEALGSPLGPHPKSDLATDLYSVSTPVAIMDESDHQVDFKHLNKSVISLSAVIKGIRLSFRIPSRKRSSYRSILWLYPDSYHG
jgi:hypothetical protein